MSSKKNKTDRIFIRVTEDQKEFIKKMADKNNMSLSSYILSLVFYNRFSEEEFQYLSKLLFNHRLDIVNQLCNKDFDYDLLKSFLNLNLDCLQKVSFCVDLDSLNK